MKFQYILVTTLHQVIQQLWFLLNAVELALQPLFVYYFLRIENHMANSDWKLTGSQQKAAKC